MYNPNPFVEHRRLHKVQLLELIQKTKNLPIEQVIAIFSLKTGLKRATIREYLDELEEAGLFDQNVGVPSKDGAKANQQENQRDNDRPAGADQCSEGTGTRNNGSKQ